MRLSSHITTLLVYIFAFSSAQDVPREKIWSSVVFTRFGDSTPYVLPSSQFLTSWGARQLMAAGAAFRYRYLDDSGLPEDAETRISGLSQMTLMVDEVNILSVVDQYVSASAHAFMQGFYPPAPNTTTTTGSLLDAANSVNGEYMDYPLGGYQYPEILAPSYKDPINVQLEGNTNCRAYEAARSVWLDSEEFHAIKAASAEFYADIYSRALQGVFEEENANFLNAYPIYEFLNYQYVHNTAATQEFIFYKDVMIARELADKWMFATNGNLAINGVGGDNDDVDDDSSILAIAGRTFAKFVVEAFEMNYHSNGLSRKLSLVFGGFEPMIAFAALAKLASENQPNFYSLPEQGASMVFELFSMETNASTDQYPDPSNLMVRFFLRNITDPSDILQPLDFYPLFGRAPGQPGMPYEDFKDEMVDIMMPVSEWCHKCGSATAFCAAYNPMFTDNSEGGSGPNHLNPAIAGGIGAFIGLVVAGFAIAGGVGNCLARVSRRMADRRGFGFGGFKGNDRRPSDPDLTFEREHVTSNAGISNYRSGGDGGRERVGSWELRNKKAAAGGSGSSSFDDTLPFAGAGAGAARRQSFDDDYMAIAEPVKAYERV
ncbi:hypothetical protein AJ79_07821 [Helicocarpus griseus UAMH5409]|uniref:Phosphoglycerate mutase-like protein n=1 Tax=Helicocarpus griseus UAMH5409 TaxID=1447875 RepID=A0A2B7WYY0_9EURO|nr:hypothetical protein AJ79_07821 [Helicocarpus griseus UAMH5409]